MGLKLCGREEQLAAIEMEINEARTARRDPGSAAQRHYEVLKSVAEDIRARMQFPRSNALGALERALDQMLRAKQPDEPYYPTGQQGAVVAVVINKWPTIRRALEQYGEESAE